MDRVTPNTLELKRLGGYLLLSWHDLSDHVSKICTIGAFYSPGCILYICILMYVSAAV